MGVFGILLFIVASICLIALFYILIFNKLQYGKTKIEHVEGLIDDDLREKYDIVVRADNAIKSLLNTKKDYLKDYTNLKDAKISNFDLERKLKEAENLILNLYNDNTELTENDNMFQIMRDFKTVNEKLTAGISYYNRQMNVLNAYIRKFPNNIIAHIHHITSKPFFDRKDMTDTDINDFKLQPFGSFLYDKKMVNSLVITILFYTSLNVKQVSKFNSSFICLKYDLIYTYL